MTINVDATAYTRNRISGLERYSHEVLLAACELRPELEEQLRFIGFIDDDWSLIKRNFPEARRLRLPLPRRLYNQFHKYLLPLHWWYRLKTPMFYPNFFQFPVRSAKAMVVVHDFAFIDTPEVVRPRNRWALNKLTPLSLGAKGAVPIAVSQFTKQRMEQEYELPQEPQIVANAVDAQQFSTPSTRPVREIYELPERYVLFLGTVEPRKNLKSLLLAYDLLEPELAANYPLVIAGRRGWLNDELDQLLAKLRGGGKQIIETGYIEDEDLSAIYQQAELFTFLSDYEGTGLPLLEAMAAGTPAVASDIPPHRDISDGTVKLVNQKLPEEIADALRAVLSEPPTQAELDKAQQQALSQNWEASARQLLKIIDTLTA